MSRIFVVSLALAWGGFTTAASAQTTLFDDLGGPQGFGDDCLAPNDDGSSERIDLTPAFPDGLNFFGITYTSFFVNTNGNITFNGSLSQFTPEAFPVADRPMIAPYWGDVDIRGGRTGSGCEGPDQNGVWWTMSPNRIVVTWDEVGVYNINDDIKMSFQMIISDARRCPGPGDFDVEFRYNRCEWEVGSFFSSGDDNNDGLCQPSEGACVPAQVGFDAGNLMDYVAVPNSLMPGIYTQMCTQSNVGETGVWRFEIRAGRVQCPGAGQVCDTGLMGVCANGQTQCVGTGVECQPEVAAANELCNLADDDCDGVTDEGEMMCPETEVCDNGSCIPRCFEGGCPEGQVCTSQGACAEASCEEVQCEAGQRCVGGECIDLCGEVTCPPNQICRVGQCVDPCDGVTCDACSACEAGLCQRHCALSGCAEGESCEEDGRCVPDACLNVRCGPGRHCVEGVCSDSCEAVTCPPGQQCNLGVCIEPHLIDAGPFDAGVPPDAGPIDAGTDNSGGDDAGDDGGQREPFDTGPPGPPPGTRTQCICRAAGAGADRPGPILGSLALLLGLAIRRRRS